MEGTKGRGKSKGYLGDCPDECPGPLTPYVGDCRGQQKVAAGSQSDRYLDDLCEHTRGYDHDFSHKIPASQHA